LASFNAFFDVEASQKVPWNFSRAGPRADCCGV